MLIKLGKVRIKLWRTKEQETIEKGSYEPCPFCGDVYVKNVCIEDGGAFDYFQCKGCLVTVEASEYAWNDRAFDYFCQECGAKTFHTWGTP